MCGGDFDERGYIRGECVSVVRFLSVLVSARRTLATLLELSRNRVFNRIKDTYMSSSIVLCIVAVV